MANSNLIAIGNAASPELRAAVEWLHVHEAKFFETTTAALWQGATAPRWIYLLCERRGVFGQAEIEALHRAWPLARLVAVCGAWCEGETRSGQPLAGVHRVYVHQFIARGKAASASDFAGWRLPRTAMPIDVSLQRTRFAPLAAKVGIIAETRADFSALADAVECLGCRAQWQRRSRSIETDIAALLWNGRSLSEAAERELLAAVELHQPLIALLDSPRSHEIERTIDCGASAVVSKPFLLGDLHAALVGLIGQAEEARAA